MCKQGPPDSCFKCDREKKMEDKRKKEEFARQERLDREQRAHMEKLAEMDAQIAQEQATIRDAQLAEENAHALRQKEKDLRDVAALASSIAAAPSVPGPSSSPTATTTPDVSSGVSPTTKAPVSAAAPPSLLSSFLTSLLPKPAAQTSHQTPTTSNASGPTTVPPTKTVPPKRRSQARDEWERQKTVEGAVNSAIDEIMAMGGLESVKGTVLDIKDTVDVSKRQGTSLKEQRSAPSFWFLRHAVLTFGFQIQCNYARQSRDW
jgi:hypothetical protein